ncbi:hypothetical protein TNCV_2577151 [Trichonephila clavipes]|nr:hypothetical protein TNCV_2577151 [Trichonephila clavipes]
MACPNPMEYPVRNILNCHLALRARFCSLLPTGTLTPVSGHVLDRRVYLRTQGALMFGNPCPLLSQAVTLSPSWSLTSSTGFGIMIATMLSELELITMVRCRRSKSGFPVQESPSLIDFDTKLGGFLR